MATDTEISSPTGLAIVDKPPAHTSHDVVARCRRIFKTRKVGHAGTLDPDATGVLLVGVGRVTRLLRFLQGLDKTYQATICFGVETDTLDASGQVLFRHELPITEEQLDSVLGRFRGTIEQIPPMVSAIKIEGEALYKKARRGETVERKPRTLTIRELVLEQFSPGSFPEATIRVTCSSGTYIRSLASDIGLALGGAAHLGTLRRLAVGSFDESAARTLDELEELASQGRAAEVLIPPEKMLPDLPGVAIEGDRVAGVLHGAVFPAEFLAAECPDATGPLAVYGPDMKLLAVYGPHRGGFKPLCVIGDA